MNTSKPETRFPNAYPTVGELAHYDREARRRRAEFIEDSFVRFVIAYDQFIRHVACRIAASLFGSDCMHAKGR